MLKRNKTNVADNTSKKTASFDDEGVIKRKKPLMEKLGLIEPIENRGEDKALSEVAFAIGLDENSEAYDGGCNKPKIESEYAEKLSIEEIFNKSGFEADQTSTIYLIESFINALPSNLPADVKRQSILNLVAASRFNIASLVDDGNSRLETLVKYYKGFSNHVDEVIDANEKSICKLNERIEQHKRVIEAKKLLREAVKTEIDFEMQKIGNIIDFVHIKNL